MSEKKKSTKKKKEVVVEEQVIETPVINEEPVVESITHDVIEDVKEEVVNLETLVEETINEELKVEEQEKEFCVSPLFTTEEKLFITKLVANGYRPFDIVKKARMSLKLSEEKMQRLSLNIRTVEQLVKALEV
jgi:hypothetical protein